MLEVLDTAGQGLCAKFISHDGADIDRGIYCATRSMDSVKALSCLVLTWTEMARDFYLCIRSAVDPVLNECGDFKNRFIGSKTLL
jgi:hypothetical protein